MSVIRAYAPSLLRDRLEALRSQSVYPLKDLEHIAQHILLVQLPEGAVLGLCKCTGDVQQRMKKEGTGIATYVRKKALGYHGESFLVPGHPFVLAEAGMR